MSENASNSPPPKKTWKARKEREAKGTGIGGKILVENDPVNKWDVSPQATVELSDIFTPQQSTSSHPSQYEQSISAGSSVNFDCRVEKNMAGAMQKIRYDLSDQDTLTEWVVWWL